MSGTVSTHAEFAAADTAAAAAKVVETARKAALREDPSRPLVYLDIEIKGQPAGRMEFVLFTKEAPRAAENFRALCTCEKGKVPLKPAGREGAGLPYCFKVRPMPASSSPESHMSGCLNAVKWPFSHIRWIKTRQMLCQDEVCIFGWHLHFRTTGNVWQAFKIGKVQNSGKDWQMPYIRPVNTGKGANM
jgi:hypothetical protein